MMKNVFSRLFFAICFVGISTGIYAQKKVIAKSVYSSVPSGYINIEGTDLYYNQTNSSIDFIGMFGGQYYSSTYSDGGYRLAIKVGDNNATEVDCLENTTINGVNCKVSVESQGELGRVIYTVTNSTDSTVIVSLGTHADVMIGNNDSAPISRRIDTIGNTYGFTMEDGAGAKLCVLFGSGLAGVNAVDDFWFDVYNSNSSVDAMVGDYSRNTYYLVENGSYDSGMGWCWKSRSIPANSSVDFSYLIGVGDVNLEPSSSFEVTPEDADGWNNLSLVHVLTLEGVYESPAGQRGKIEYSVEDSEDWLSLTDEVESGSTFNAEIKVQFEEGREYHIIRLRTTDVVGNTTLLTPISFQDISFVEVKGIEDKIYNRGKPITQDNISTTLSNDKYLITNYKNNTDAGMAMFNVEGVFPYTIGKKTYAFTIAPLELSGSICLSQYDYVYNGDEQFPKWSFTDELNTSLKEEEDYVISYIDNILPGTATLIISGTNNYSGSLTENFFIDKAKLTNELYRVVLPNEDITYDGHAHIAEVEPLTSGIGTINVYYIFNDENDNECVQPTEVGTYQVYLSISDGDYYYGISSLKLGEFSIFQFDSQDWQAIQDITPILSSKGWVQPWDLTCGIEKASSLHGLSIEQGRVVGLNLSGNGLTGTFPTEIFKLANLKSINLSSNNLSGTFDFIYNYLGTNALRNINSLDLSGNNFEGNLTVLASAFPNLTSLNVNSNCIKDIYPALSEKITDLKFGGQKIDYTLNIDLSNLTGNEFSNIPTLVIYDSENHSYDNYLNIKCDDSNDWSVVMTYDNGELYYSEVSSNNVYYGNSGDLLSATAFSNHGQDSSIFQLKLEFEKGDANFNGKVDVLDLQSSILYTFGEYNNKPFNFTAANTYVDDTINVQDIVCTVDIILIQEENNIYKIMSSYATSNIGYERPFKTNIVENVEASICAKDGQIMLLSNLPIAALCVNASGNINWDLSKYGLTQSFKNNTVIGYSLTNATVPIGENIIGNYTGEIHINSVTLADKDAQNIEAEICQNTTSSMLDTNSISTSEDEFFDMYGRKLPKPQRGINIVKRGASYIKIINI